MWQKILLVLGILGILVGGVVIIITGIVVATSKGRVSGDEALPGFIGGGCCCSLSVVLGLVGLVLVMKGRKKPEAGLGSEATPKP